MKKVIVMIAAACIAFAGLADSTGATTNWVARFVADYVGKAISNSTAQISSEASTARTNDVDVTTFKSNGIEMNLVYEPASIGAVIAQECAPEAVALGVTDGTFWAWKASRDRYENRGLGSIAVTASNMTWRAYRTMDVGNATYFTEDGTNRLFRAYSTTITRSKAETVWEE